MRNEFFLFDEQLRCGLLYALHALGSFLVSQDGLIHPYRHSGKFEDFRLTIYILTTHKNTPPSVMIQSIRSLIVRMPDNQLERYLFVK